MKEFLESDVQPHGAVPGAGTLYADRAELIDSPLEWQKRGLQETASGYGAKLTTPNLINFNHRRYRLYCTCYGNAGSVWFKAKGRTIFVN